MKTIDSENISSEGSLGKAFYRSLIVVLIGVPVVILAGVLIFGLSQSSTGRMVLLLFLKFFVVGTSIVVAVFVAIGCGRLGERLCEMATWEDFWVALVFYVLGFILSLAVFMALFRWVFGMWG